MRTRCCILTMLLPVAFSIAPVAAQNYPAKPVRFVVGFAAGGSVDGEELSDPKFHPFWAKAEQLGVLIFIHPQGTTELSASGRLKGNGVLDNVIGNPLETTIALSHLIFEGTLDNYPGLKICAAHAGGYLERRGFQDPPGGTDR